MVHESMLVVTARGESIGTIIHDEGDDTFLAERERSFPRTPSSTTKASPRFAKMGRSSIR
jgi:hypothetical protein